MTRILIAIMFVVAFGCAPKKQAAWPTITSETKPWTRWWWHGSAVTKEGITLELEQFAKAELGGVEITPIYGVHGTEDQFVNYLSDEWVALLIHTLSEAKRLNLGVDMATGTGWPFGGPWVTDGFASRNVYHKVYPLKGGQTLLQKIEFIQPPLLRTVIDKADIKDLAQPVSANKNLQQLAIDQVQFERKIPLISLVAIRDCGIKPGNDNKVCEPVTIDLTDHVKDGTLDWTAPAGNWQLYAVFSGWHGKMVERAGPGGEGNVIDHFSIDALQHYLHRFDSAFKGKDIASLRAFFNDSYEVDDAQGAANWTPRLLDEFETRRGYRLQEHFQKFFSKDTSDIGRKVLYDYRLTLSELLQERFTNPWTEWAAGKAALTRNQAHGSPANILDLYASVNIPEIEGTEPLRIRMASSAANVTGKPLVSSESATWLDEHFKSSLGDIKSAVDLFLLNGVNHIFYHGTSYSPKDDPWPGWLFYAAVHLNSRNPQWNDFHALNEYISRTQSFLQNSTAANDVLLYYPVADPMSTPNDEMIVHFDGIGKQFEGSAFEEAALWMLKNGYTFDYISDKQLGDVKVNNDSTLITSGGGNYKTILIPSCRYIPYETLMALEGMAAKGANIIFYKDAPRSFAGFKSENSPMDIPSRLKQFTSMLQTADLEGAMNTVGIPAEQLGFAGFEFTRRRKGTQTIYFVRHAQDGFDGWLKTASPGEFVTLYDPITGQIGTPAIDPQTGAFRLKVYDRQTMLIIVDTQKIEARDFDYYDISTEASEVPMSWNITFESGGPVLPPARENEVPGSWTLYYSDADSAAYRAFSGTARYTTKVVFPENSPDGWLLVMDSVRESAEVILNGKVLATVFSAPFCVKVEPSMAQPENVLELRISNSMANRAANLDRNGVKWKKFYNINFPARRPENRKDGLFDASQWEPAPSGLVGWVRIYRAERFSNPDFRAK